MKENPVPMEDRIYSAYGTTGAAASAGTAYTGEVMETSTGWYVLGSRVYASTLRRFLCADPASPFGRGGTNRYAYCAGDPINRVDPTGGVWQFWAAFPWRLKGAGGGNRTRGQTASATTTHALASTPTEAAVVSASLPAPANVPRHSVDRFNPGSMPERPRQRPALNDPPSAEMGPYGSLVVKHEPEGRDVFLDADLHTLEIMAEWHPQSLRLDDARVARHWLADSAINYDHVVHPLRKIAGSSDAQAPGPIYVYVGVHGSSQGDNWATGIRQSPAPAGARDTFDIQAEARTLGLGGQLSIENIANISEGSLEAAMRREGEHVHAYCYSAVDRLVLRVLNVPPVPVYVFR